MARRRMYGSAISSMRIAVMTRVSSSPSLEHVLHGERVDHRAEHSHVVGADAVHSHLGELRAANDVAAADHQADAGAHARRLSLIFVGEALDNVEIEPDALVSGECFAGDLEQNPRVLEIGAKAGSYSSPIWKRTNRRTWMFSPTFADASLIRSPIVFFGSRTQAWCTQRDVLVVRLDLSCDDLLDQMVGLSARLDLLDEDAALALDLVLRDLILVDRDRRRGGDVLGDVLARAVLKSSVRATKSVSQLISTITPTLPLWWM